MLRGTTKLVNDVALAIETALPFSTSGKSGWKVVTPERKKMCVAASRAAINVLCRYAQDTQAASIGRKLKRTLGRDSLEYVPIRGPGVDALENRKETGSLTEGD